MAEAFGDEIPAPCELLDLLHDEKIKQGIASGAFLIPIPLANRRLTELV
jgi:hypothetical protein